MNYVLGFLFRRDLKEVVLIKKSKPEWMKEKLNGVGGKIETGEEPLEAMIREFKEETNLDIVNWTQFASIHTADNEMVYVYYAVSDADYMDNIEASAEEPIIRMDPNQLMTFVVVENVIQLVDRAKKKILNEDVSTVTYE